MGHAWIDGRPVELQSACAEAARLLGASRLPVIAGLGTDIGGARAAIALAERVGAVIDHAHSDALLRDLDVVREAGMMATTPGEARVRSDVFLFAGPLPADAWAHLVRAGTGTSDRQIFWLCPGRAVRGDAARGARVQTIGRDPADLPAIVAALRALVARRPVGPSPAPAKTQAGVAAQLQSARFGVAVWSAAALDALTIEMLCGLVKDLNANTRFSGLPLPPGDNASGVLQACGWMTGLPPRTGFGRGFPEHDPWRFDARRLVESGEADCVLWISAYRPAAPPWDRDLPTIALTADGAAFRRHPRVHVTVGHPGIDHDAVEYLAATGTLAWVTAARHGDTIRVADALAAITARLPEGGAPPC
jgi:formylmethanofuran dehydrogenase subunit B